MSVGTLPGIIASVYNDYSCPVTILVIYCYDPLKVTPNKKYDIAHKYLILKMDFAGLACYLLKI